MMNEVITLDEEWMGKHYDYAPDNWVLIKVNGTHPHYRVFGSWRGGYLHGDSWRLNSGVKSVDLVGDYYFFHGHSNSVYRCHKDAYGNLGSYGWSEAQHICKDGNGYLMDEPENILEMEWE